MWALLIPLFTWMMNSFVRRVLFGAGLTLLTYAGLLELGHQFISSVMTNINGMPVVPLQLIGMMGGGEALSIMFSVIITKAVFNASKVTLGHIGAVGGGSGTPSP